LDILKQESIVTHKNWIENGRPKQGTLFDAKAKAELKYKLYIKQKTNMERAGVSDALHDALILKNNNQFWNMWKKKFNKQDNHSIKIDGLCNNAEIVNGFADLFANNMNILEDEEKLV